MEEGLIRNLPAFARFLDAVAFTHGEMVNHSNIARDCGVDSKTVKEYYQILVDTLIGYYLEPFYHRNTRDIISSTPKFYLFDTGVANFLAKTKMQALKGKAAGGAFEHYILMELMAYRSLRDSEFPINYWRVKDSLEVDFILAEGKVAIEAKITDKVDRSHLKGLLAFIEYHQPEKAILVCNVPRKRIIKVENGTDIQVIPWKEFLEDLWAEKIL